VGLVIGLNGCANLGYYTQSFTGQLDIIGRQRPIDELLRADDTDPALKAKLWSVTHMRDFATRELGLPDNDSYRSYADVERPYVVWNVFATEEFSTKLKRWCFPIAGCVGYRGYFKQDTARAYGDTLRAQGLDVRVAGIAAYSTLGWLQDPVLNTVIKRDDIELAGLLFHELAHQVAYVGGDSTFNESFATAVEIEGLRRWMAHNATPEQFARYQTAKARDDAFRRLVLSYRGRLDELYARPLPAEEKRAAKARVFDELRADYARLKASWGGHGTYDRWFADELNNAKIAAVATYASLVPAFERLLAEHGHDLPRFYRTVKALTKLPKEERYARLGVVDPGAPLMRQAVQE